MAVDSCEQDAWDGILREALMNIVGNDAWHWFAYHFSFLPPHPLARSIVDACSDCEMKLPGLGLQLIRELSSICGLRQYEPHYDELLQKLAEILVFRRLLTLDWPRGTVFSRGAQDTPADDGGLLRVTCADRSFVFGVKTPGLLDKLQTKSADAWLSASGSGGRRPEQEGEVTAMTMPRENALKDFLVKADKTFARLQDGVAHTSILVVVWDDQVDETTTVLTHDDGGLLRSSSYLRGPDGAALRFPNIDAVVVVPQQVRESSESIATGSGQLSMGNSDLSQRTEEQASNLEEAAASMEQLTATVQQNSETASTAARLANSTMDAAVQGGAMVGQVVKSMERVGEASRRISEIIGVIDSIAFQTNILALNAAVEAARAGEQGRGFAVVASEVRSLAQRCAEAAKQVKTLVNANLETVEAGNSQVQGAGRTMEEVVRQVREVHTLISEINVASAEQSNGIKQVGFALTQLDQVTQQNAALVEESASAADSLNQQARRLTELVAVFKV